MQSSKKILFFALCVAALQAQAESWLYQAWNPDGSKGGVGYITLTEKGPDANLQFFTGDTKGLEKCVQRELKATVVRDAEAVTITTEPLMQGCISIRFVLKADGSGGVREVKRGGTWVADGKERNLALKK